MALLTKKGNNLFNIIFAVIIGAVATIVVLSIFKHHMLSTSHVVSNKILSISDDFDNDHIPDFSDDSPCVAGKRTVIVSSNGKKEYFYRDLPSSGDCNDIDVDPGYVLKKVTDISTGKEVCILTDKSCALLIKKRYECLKNDKTANC